MGKFFKALAISTVATGVVAFVVHKLQQPSFPPPPRDVEPQPNPIDADDLSEAERTALMNELSSQL